MRFLWDTGIALREWFYSRGFIYPKSDWLTIVRTQSIQWGTEFTWRIFWECDSYWWVWDFTQRFWELRSLVVLPVDYWRRIISVDIIRLLQYYCRGYIGNRKYCICGIYSSHWEVFKDFFNFICLILFILVKKSYLAHLSIVFLLFY